MVLGDSQWVMPLLEFPMGKTTTERSDLEIDGSSASMAIVMFNYFGRLPMGDATMGDSDGQNHNGKKRFGNRRKLRLYGDSDSQWAMPLWEYTNGQNRIGQIGNSDLEIEDSSACINGQHRIDPMGNTTLEKFTPAGTS